MNEILVVLTIPFAVSFLLSLYVTPRMRLISYNGNLFFPSSKGMGKEHFEMEIGGMPLFPIMLISMCFTFTFPHVFQLEAIQQQVEPTILRIMQIIVGCAFLYIMGVKDDFNGTDTKYKFLVLILTAAMFPATGLWINDLHGLFGIHAIPQWAGMPLTLLLAAFLTQLPSITDSPDGRFIGICTMLVMLFMTLSIYCNHAMSAIIASATIGATLPFSLCKKFSKKWGKTLIGSSGNYILGYILSYMTIGLTRQCGDRLPGEAVMVCFGIIILPLMDALRVLKDRVAENRDILKPDKNQMQHLLIRAGVPKRLVSLTHILVILVFTALNLLCVCLGTKITIIFFIDIIALIIFSFTINHLISHYESLHAYYNWNKVYGRDAWESNVPRETLDRKIRNFGTMGLPPDMVSSNTGEFIPDGMSGIERGAKRLADLLASIVCILIFSPLFLICSIMIKLNDGGPVIYRQERIGRFGRPFYVYKFRSMRTDAEKDGPELSHAEGKDDPRLTKVGKFLRAHHLDELPQLWNVFKGDMAFVGYRPERKYFIDKIMEHDPRYSFLYQIRPGVTSYATLHYGYADTVEKMLRRTELDLHYLKNRSWWFDFKVLFLTFAKIASGKKF